MKSLMMFSAVVGMSVVSLAGEVIQKPLQRSIILSAGDGPFVFRRGVSLTVCYRNSGQEPWVVPLPSESISVGLRYRPSGSEQRPQGYDFGRRTSTTIKRPDGREMTAHVFPIPRTLEIAPSQSHKFKVVLERGWSEVLEPGLWTVWVVDDNLKVESNRIEIPLVFTADSVAACLEIAADDKEDVYKRKWHAKWLQKVMPDLKLHWWSDDALPPEKERLQAEVQQNLAAFKVFWKDKSNATAIAEAISRINREAGLK